MDKALIAMSGGVDSSVAALLTKNRGLSCMGCTMKLYSNADIGLEHGRTCCSLEDVEDARSVAYRLGMPYYVFNFTREFQEQVVSRFVQAYEMGITPNPCIDCNRCMKFEKLYQRAMILGCRYLVTGHYARIEYDGSRYLLKKAADPGKDQSYVLYSMTQEQLAHILLPLGELRKAQVRQIAAENGFCNAEKADSQDICFVPDGDYAGFIERYRGRPSPEGNFLDSSGAVIGQHRGVVHYTVGQRRGLGLSLGKPMYVTSIDAEKNTVTLGENRELYSSTVIAENFHWISGSIPDRPLRCTAKLRYRQPEQDAVAIPMEDGTIRILFDKPQRAATPGQAAVLYSGDIVLGGGTIRSERESA